MTRTSSTQTEDYDSDSVPSSTDEAMERNIYLICTIYMHVMPLAYIYRIDFQSNTLDERYDENDENESDKELQNDPSRQRKYGTDRK